MSDDISTLPSGPSKPVWVIVPGTPGGGEVDPDYDIDEGPQAPDGAHPSHPIVLPPELVDPGWGISIERPDNTLPGDQPEIDNELPGDQPVIDNSLPGNQPGIDNSLPGVPAPPVDPPKPAHPIYINPYPDNELPAGSEQVGGIKEFYQRKTLGINWDASLLAPSLTVGIYAVTGDDASLVRTVPNNGASSVTYPLDFTGEVTIRVAGANGYLEGSYTVK